MEDEAREVRFQPVYLCNMREELTSMVLWETSMRVDSIPTEGWNTMRFNRYERKLEINAIEEPALDFVKFFSVKWKDDVLMAYQLVCQFPDILSIAFAQIQCRKVLLKYEVPNMKFRERATPKSNADIQQS